MKTLTKNQINRVAAGLVIYAIISLLVNTGLGLFLTSALAIFKEINDKQKYISIPFLKEDKDKINLTHLLETLLLPFILTFIIL